MKLTWDSSTFLGKQKSLFKCLRSGFALKNDCILSAQISNRQETFLIYLYAQGHSYHILSMRIAQWFFQHVQSMRQTNKGPNHFFCPVLKGPSSEPIFWVECKHLFVIEPILGSPNSFDLASYSQRYSYSKINSPLSFTTESQNS